jgi:carbon monoxide dehydrogenase subunit G
MEFSSEWKTIAAPAETVFNFVSDLNNLGKLMPEQVINWESTADTCSFTIKGMANIPMRVVSRIPARYIGLEPEGKAPFDFKIDIDFKDKGEQCETQVKLDAALNPMLAMMAKRPLQNLVNIIVQKLGAVDFSGK